MSRGFLDKRWRNYYYQNAYASRVLATNPIAYWPLNEGSGSVIQDKSGNGYDGAYTGVTWDGTQFVKGGPVPFWDGANDYGDVYSAGFASAFDLDEGCILIWVKMADASVWTDVTTRTLYLFQRDAGNRVFFNKLNSANEIRLRRTGNGTSQTLDHTINNPDWFSVILSWSVMNDALKLYINGVQAETTQMGLLASVGSGLDSSATVLGAASQAPIQIHHGYLGNVAIYNRSIDNAILALAS